MTVTKKFLLIFVVVLTISTAAILYYLSLPSGIQEVERIYITTIVGEEVDCKIRIRYAASSFDRLVSDWNDNLNLIVEEVSVYKEPGTSIRDLNITYSRTLHMVFIDFNVTGAVSISHGSCRATFIWLLEPLGLDFIDDHFNEYNDRLTWSGEINNVKYTVKIMLPEEDEPYSAWGSLVGHCHGHVWWPCQG